MNKNIILIGPPGCGKSTIGKILANFMKRGFLDVDDFMEEENHRTVGNILEELGDEAFLDFEAKETLKIKATNSIISTTGSNPLRPEAMKYLQKNGLLVYIDPPLKMIEDRLERMKVDRIVGMKTETIGNILKWRKENYYDIYDYDIHIKLKKPESSLVIAGLILGELKVANYKSTRGDETTYSFPEAVLKGMAKDGGLLVPEYLPFLKTKTINELRQKNYRGRAASFFKMFGTEFSKEEIDNIVKEAYGENFDNKEIAPLKQIKDKQYLLELWHGPTSAFKDMALQFKPICFSKSIELENKKRIAEGKEIKQYLILTATSGDTGKAALEGYKNRKQIKIAVFYPKDGVSEIQRKQMVTQEGNNVAVHGIDGNFDDAQNAVKQLFNDQRFNQKLNEKNIFLSTANSINWGRILPQIFYYISAYFDLLNKNIVLNDELIDIAVPTGNFGNILAAYYAREMGVPIDKLICASNENNVLTEFIQTGIYDVRKRDLIKTPSPSMDILVSSNLERLLYEISKDSGKVNHWMLELKEKQYFKVDSDTKARIQKRFVAGKCHNEETLKTIKSIYKETGELLDPHTAVVQHVTAQYLQITESKKPVIMASTAHWAKFGSDVYKALNGLKYKDRISNLDEFKILEEISKKTNKKIPKNLSQLINAKESQTNKCSKDFEKLQKTVLKFIQK